MPLLDYAIEEITNYIRLIDLQVRWLDKEIDGIKLDFNCIEYITYNEQLIAYHVTSYRFKNGKKTPLGYRVNNLKDGNLPFGSPEYIFDLSSVYEFEKDNGIDPNLIDCFDKIIPIHCEEDLPIQKGEVTPNQKKLITFTTALAERDKEIADLQAALSAKDARIAELEAQLKEKQAAYETESCDNTRTLKASLERSRKDFTAWKEALPYMLEVYRQCIEGGKKERTEYELKSMFEKVGFTIGDTMLKEFKKSLPDGYVKRTAGASRQ